MTDNNNNPKTNLGKINVGKRALSIEELEDKVRFAVDAYKRAFDKYERGADSLQDWDMVIKALTMQLEELRDYIAVAHHNVGIIYASKGNFRQSIEHLEKALRFNPKYPVAHYNLALALKKVGELEKAKKHFETAKELGFRQDKS